MKLRQTADKGVRTVKLTKSFDRPFLKGRRVLGQSPESPSAEGEMPLIRPKSGPQTAHPFNLGLILYII